MRKSATWNRRLWTEPAGLQGWGILSRRQRREALALLRAGVESELPSSLAQTLAEASFAPWGATYLADLYPDALAFLAWLARHESWGMLGPRPLLEPYLRAAYSNHELPALIQRALCGRADRPQVDPDLAIRFLADELPRPRWFRFADRPSRSAEAMLQVLRRLGGRAQIRDLPLLFACWTPDRVQSARDELGERLFVFADLDADSLELCLGLLSVHSGDVA
tara:strand:- start:592 stop:1257 length:666 start_codon:yes stop_codon:yes gene_type:complete